MELDFKNLIIITGPSGVGKTSVALELLKKHADIRRIVTYTTREKREGEVDGVDYNFISEKKFKEILDHNEFFEYAKVYDHSYGNRLADLHNICSNNKFCLMVLDIQGAQKLKKEFPKSKGFFITASFEALAERLIKRGKMEEKDFATRQKIAKEEMEKAQIFDHKIENREGKLDEAVGDIEKILGV